MCSGSSQSLSVSSSSPRAAAFYLLTNCLSPPIDLTFAWRVWQHHFVYFWHKGMDLDNMCGSNLFVRTSSFIFLNSFVEKTRLSLPGGGVTEDT